MPEGHSVHRIARQFRHNFVGKPVALSSPQGRFVDGAKILSGRTMTRAQAVGKQMFLEFEGELTLRIHLGIYGAWDFAGEIIADPSLIPDSGKMGQNQQKGTVLPPPAAMHSAVDLDGLEDSFRSIGAPRRTRLKMGEETSEVAGNGFGDGGELENFPPDPVGQVRVRLLTDVAVADLRGPTVCEVMTPEEVQVVLNRLGPDPASMDPAEEAAAVDALVARIQRSNQTIAVLLMDQSVVAGIGNVYRAEMLFRANLNPYLPGKSLNRETIVALWEDWKYLLAEGIRTGQMVTIDGLEPEQFRLAMADRKHRHWVYRRQGKPCLVCGTPIAIEELAARNLFYCPNCQQ